MKEGISYLNESQLKELFASLDSGRDQLLFLVLYETGCTVKELVHIKREHIDFENETISFPGEHSKSKKARVTQISPELTYQLKHFVRNKEVDEFLFSSRESERMSPRRVRQIVKAYGRNALQQEITPISLRYTHIAHAISRGIPLSAIQDQVGLKNLRLSQLSKQFVKKQKRGYTLYSAK